LVRNITKVCYHNDSDVAVGIMDFHRVNATGKPLTNKTHCFTTEVPRVGSRVGTYTYPESDRIFCQGEAGKFVANYYSGEMIAHSDMPRD
jgi:hypothetical protein